MNRAIIYTAFGGPEVLELQDIAEPHAGSDEIRVRVAAAGLNPMDWKISSNPNAAAMFGITLPAGFGSDFAGTIDEVGSNIKDFHIGDRVFGGALGRAVADYIVVNVSTATLHRTPNGMPDVVASTLPVAGLTADAALGVIGVKSGDTVLIGGAAGGVGTFAVQLATLAGATVIGTGSEGSFDYLHKLGAIPVTYGPGLTDRVRKLAPHGVDAATDLVGTETIDVALALGLAPARISAIAAGPDNLPSGVHATGASQASPGALARISDAISSGKLTIPIAATFPIERAREAVTLQRGGHVHGKVVITLSE